MPAAESSSLLRPARQMGTAHGSLMRRVAASRKNLPWTLAAVRSRRHSFRKAGRWQLTRRTQRHTFS